MKWGERAVHVLSDAAILAGAGLAAYGAYLAYEPAGFLVAGMEMMALGLIAGR